MLATLPPGYFYRPSKLTINALGTATATFNGNNGFQVGMQGLFFENGVLAYTFGIFNIQNLANIAGTTVNAAAAIKIADDAVTNDFQAFFLTREPISQILLDARQGTTTCQITWMDTSADATAAISVNWRLEMMRFTVEQGLSYEVNAPILTYDNHF